MSDRADPAEDRYDAIVVGTGLGGLSAASILAKAGLSVLAVERQDGPGGCARAFQRGGYVFDPAIHVTVEVAPGRLVDRLLEWLGAGEACTFLQLDHLYGAVFPGFSINAPFGAEACLAAHQEALPEDAAGVRAFFEIQQRFFREGLSMAMSLGLAELGEAVERFPTFFRYRSATLGDVIDETVRGSRAKAVLGSLWPYFGVPPSQLAFLGVSPFQGVATETGPWYCKGGFGQLADALASALARNGGELLTGTPAEAIEIEDGKVAGVVLEGGRRVRATTVVSNADAHHTFAELIGVAHLPRALVRRLDRLEPSLSAVVVYAATSLDMRALGAAQESFLFRHWDHDESYRDARDARAGGMWASVPTLIDPSLAPAGEHLVIMSCLAPFEAGQDKERIADAMVAEFEGAMFPGLRESLNHYEVAGPLDFRRELGTRDGAIYGWAMTPKQMGSKRLARAGPLEGLWLAGAWTEEGSGSFRAILSGLTTAQAIMGAAGVEVDMPVFRSEDLPQQVLGG